MPRTEVIVGTYVEHYDRIHRVIDIFYPEADSITPYAKLVEINVDKEGKITEGNSLDCGIVAWNLQPVAYSDVVLWLAIHDRQQELDAQVKRAAELTQEIEGLRFALQVLKRNLAINGDPDE